MPPLNSVTAIDYGFIGLYLAIVIWVGLVAARKNRGSADFFQAGGKVPWFLAGTSNWISGFTAYMFVAASGVTYRTGTSALLLFTCAVWAYVGGYFVYARLWRRARLQAPMEFLTRRYSPGTTYFYSLTAIPLQILQIGATLYAISVFISSALGWGGVAIHLAGLTLDGVRICILVLGLVVIFYSVTGGLWAAVLSDSIQGLVVATMSVLILPISLHYLGQARGGGVAAGIQRLFQELPSDYLRPNLHAEYGGPLFLVAYVAMNFLIYNVFWHQAQRYNSVPGERDARKMSLLCAALSLVGPLLWVVPVMAAKLIFPDLGHLWPHLKAPEEAAFVSMVLLLLPHGMIGFVVAAIISTSLGYANDSFNWLAAAVTRDVYLPIRRRMGIEKASERHQVHVAQGTMVVIGGCGMAVAFLVPQLGGVFSFSLYYTSLTICSYYTPVALGLVFRRTPWWSGLAACLGSLAVCGVLAALRVCPAHHGFERNALAAVLTASAIFVLSGFWYDAGDPRNASIAEFDAELRRPLATEGPGSIRGDMSVYRLVGSIGIGLGVALGACSLLPSLPFASGWTDAVAGAVLCAMGVVLRRIGAPQMST